MLGHEILADAEPRLAPCVAHVLTLRVSLVQGLAAMMQPDENLAEQAEDGEHGLLVSQILETKKSMEEELKGKTQIVSQLN